MTRDEFVNLLCVEGLRVTPEMRPALLDFIRSMGEAIYDPALPDAMDREQIQYAIRAFTQEAEALERFVDKLVKLRDVDYGREKIKW